MFFIWLAVPADSPRALSHVRHFGPPMKAGLKKSCNAARPKPCWFWLLEVDYFTERRDHDNSDKSIFTDHPPAGGGSALKMIAEAPEEQSIGEKGTTSLLRMNQLGI